MTDRPLPSPAPPRAALFGFPQAGKRWPRGVRAALALGVPALIITLLGRQTEAFMVMPGAFAFVYADGKAYRKRWQVALIAAVALIGSTWLGALVGKPVHEAIAHGGSHFRLLWVVLIMAAVGVIGAYAVDTLRLGPPGAFFAVLCVEVGSLTVQSGLAPSEIAAWGAVGAASALLVTMSGVLVAPHRPEEEAVAAARGAVAGYADHRNSGDSAPQIRHLASLRLQAAWQCLRDAGRYGGRGYDDAAVRAGDDALVDELIRIQAQLALAVRHDPTTDPESDLDDIRPDPPAPPPSLRYRLIRSLHPASHAWTSAMRLLCAMLVAGVIAVALDIDRPDWAVLTAALVLHQGPDRVLGTYRGLHRIGGTVLGILLFTALYALEPPAAWLVVILAVLQGLIEVLVARNYGLAVVFITPLALTFGTIGHPHGNAGTVIWARLSETAIGVAIALLVLWTIDRNAHRRILHWVDGRVAEFIAKSIALSRTPDESSAARAVLRRDLEFELVGSAMAGVDAAHNDPGWTQPRWSAHSELHHLGYDVLAGYWHAPNDPAMARQEADDWERRLDALRAAPAAGD